MKKRFFFIASLMLCLTLGSTASYAKESISENAQVIEGENIADNAGDSKQLQQEKGGCGTAPLVQFRKGGTKCYKERMACRL